MLFVCRFKSTLQIFASSPVWFSFASCLSADSDDGVILPTSTHTNSIQVHTPTRLAFSNTNVKKKKNTKQKPKADQVAIMYCLLVSIHAAWIIIQHYLYYYVSLSQVISIKM